MQATENDLSMTPGTAEEVAGGWAVGYTVQAPVGVYNSLIIETKDGTVLGCPFDVSLSGAGEVKLGVQIEADTEEKLKEIENVYISTRTVSGNTATEVQE